jgi:hypothetical protein
MSPFFSSQAILEIEVFGDILRRVKGVVSGRYLSLNQRGRLSSTVGSSGVVLRFIYSKIIPENCSERMHPCLWRLESPQP